MEKGQIGNAGIPPQIDAMEIVSRELGWLTQSDLGSKHIEASVVERLETSMGEPGVFVLLKNDIDQCHVSLPRDSKTIDNQTYTTRINIWWVCLKLGMLQTDWSHPV